MSELWQRFVRTFGDAETAGVAFLVVIGGMIASVALVIHWLTIGRYAAALALMLALSAVTGVCIRDFRRGRWGVLSRALMAIWLLIIAAAMTFGIWVAIGQG